MDAEWKDVSIYLKRDGTAESLDGNKLNRMNDGGRGYHFTRWKQGEKLNFEFSKFPSFKPEGENVTIILSSN